MEKLYKQIDGVWHYHEAWADRGTLTEHWGMVGDRGQTKETKLPKGARAAAAIREALRSVRESGFEPFDEDDYATILVEYKIDGFGNKQDLEKRHSLEDRMNETLGWNGLGHCDGGSIGSGTMDVCCYVVAADIAKRVIAEDLAGTEFSDYSRIVDEETDA
jgi:hypothetical protein